MEQNLAQKTHAKIMHRIPKTDTNFGAEPATTIPTDKPSIVIFGGERTQSVKSANYYASLLLKLMQFYKIAGVDIYSVFYDFDSEDRSTERKNTFIRARSRLLQDTPIIPADTQYIQELYDIVIRPRITTISGKKLLEAQALHKIRNVIFFTHSHGSTPVYEFQKIMFRDMKNLGYDIPAIHRIMRNLLVIQHAPMSPLEKSRFNTVSFMSANDTQMDFHNQFSEYVAEHAEDITPSYFALGNFFAAYNLTYDSIAEHHIVGLLPNQEQDMLTPDGAIIMSAERNAIINATNAMLRSEPIPSNAKLIAPAIKTDSVRPDFTQMSQNGEFFMGVMNKDLRQKKSKER